MSYDTHLADRIRRELARYPTSTERAMFGGLCFMVDGRMCVGLVGDELMVRVGPAAYEDALNEPHVRPMDFTGRPMRGYVFVEADGCATPATLRRWIDTAAKHLSTLDEKKPHATKKPRSARGATRGRTTRPRR